jgi:predicted amidohydrolase YtcJ
VAERAFADGIWGRLRPGASADLVWLDRDPRDTPALEIPASRVRGTYLRGKLVYPFAR